MTKRKSTPSAPAQCFTCGSKGSVKTTARAGRRVEYRGLSLTLPSDLRLAECSVCHDLWLDDAEADAYTAAVEAAYTDALLWRAEVALKKLDAVVTQTRLEQLLHLSHGYVSKVRHRATIPSALLVSQLSLLAKDPKRRIAEIEKLWTSERPHART
jgi:hypothetical protein